MKTFPVHEVRSEENPPSIPAAGYVLDNCRMEEHLNPAHNADLLLFILQQSEYSLWIAYNRAGRKSTDWGFHNAVHSHAWDNGRSRETDRSMTLSRWFQVLKPLAESMKTKFNLDNTTHIVIMDDRTLYSETMYLVDITDDLDIMEALLVIPGLTYDF